MAAGTIYVEINLDDSPYQKAQQKLLESTKSASATIESSFKSIGSATAAVFESMKEKVASSFTTMSNYAKSAATTIYESMKNAAAWTWDSMKSVGSWIGDSFKGVSQSVKDTLSQISTAIGGMAASWGVQRAAFTLFGEAAGAALSTVFTWIGALIVGYKSLDFAIGLITGKSYKSESIDALIAEKKAVEDLSVVLGSSGAVAQSFKTSMDRLGVSSSDITAVFGGVTKSVRTNTDELDRLGITYKDANGRMLDQNTILQNAKGALDQYTEGWDRDQAAVAIGMGSHKQMSDTLKVTQQELQRSKEDLDRYHLGIGAESATAVEAYQKAMLEFNYETKMMGDGMTRAIADQVMPAFTSLAKMFTSGWPFIVDVFRYSTATMTSLMWGVTNFFQQTVDIWKGVFNVGADIFVTIGNVAIKALSGDMSGAKAELAKGWDNIKKDTSKTWAEMNSPT